MNFDEWWKTVPNPIVRNHNPYANQIAQDAWSASRKAALEEVLAEWNKPWGLSEGKTFIERLEQMVEEE